MEQPTSIKNIQHLPIIREYKLKCWGTTTWGKNKRKRLLHCRHAQPKGLREILCLSLEHVLQLSELKEKPHLLQLLQSQFWTRIRAVERNTWVPAATPPPFCVWLRTSPKLSVRYRAGIIVPTLTSLPSVCGPVVLVSWKHVFQSLHCCWRWQCQRP